MASSVAIENISKNFGKKMVLNEISLNIEEGNIYGFIGPSGSGKTTLVKMIVGMDSPDKGAVYVLNERAPQLNLLQQIGYMAQSDALYTTLTGNENLKFFGSLYTFGKSEMMKRIAYAANLVNLTDALNQKVSTYSGGMKRRLSLAIALLHNPNILILDEPTVGIDPELRLSIWKELLRLKNEEGKTIIVTTHVMDEAERCDHIAMIRDGRILADGTPAQLKEMYRAESFDEIFLKAGRDIHEDSSNH